MEHGLSVVGTRIVRHRLDRIHIFRSDGESASSDTIYMSVGGDETSLACPQQPFFNERPYNWDHHVSLHYFGRSRVMAGETSVVTSAVLYSATTNVSPSV